MFVLLILLFITTVGTMKIVCERGEYYDNGGKNGGLGGVYVDVFCFFFRKTAGLYVSSHGRVFGN